MTDPTMPELFRDLTDATGRWAEQAPEPFDYAVYELTSKRRLSATDDKDLVTVVMDDFKVSAIRVDPLWAAAPERRLDEIEERIAAAVNVVLHRYLVAEFTEAQNAQVPMSEIHDKLKELSADFSAAYERVMGSIEARTAR